MPSTETLNPTLSAKDLFASDPAVMPLPDAIVCDGFTEGLATTADYHVLHESDSRNNSVDVPQAVHFIEKAPETTNSLGFQLVKDEQSSFFVAPTVSKLNETRANLPADLGLNSGTFVAVPENLIPTETYVGHIARREIPMSVGTNITYTRHDMGDHMLGFAVMHEDTFSVLVALAQRAIASKDRRLIHQAADAIDAISAGLTIRNNPNIQHQYRLLGTPPILAGIKAKRGMRNQAELFDKLQALAN